MALHRDIFWLGRQWAVTGYGVQACDQRQRGEFDIEASQLWEDRVEGSLRAKDWLNVEDFDKALAVARKRYPPPPQEAACLEQSLSHLKDGDPLEHRPKSAQIFDMRLDGLSAKFGPLWRIRARR